MRYAKGQKEETRRRIVDTAARLFRNKGVDGVGLDEIMREAGLTHGGFYNHFRSKDALVAEACAAAVAEAGDRWKSVLAELPTDEAFGAFVNQYLAQGGCEEDSACPIAMLGPDVARKGEPVRQAYTARVQDLVEYISGELGRTREEAILTFAAVVGATTIARASGDPAFSAEVLAATEAALTGRMGVVPGPVDGAQGRAAPAS